MNIIIGGMNNKKGQITLYFIIIMVVYFFGEEKKNTKETKEEVNSLIFNVTSFVIWVLFFVYASYAGRPWSKNE